MIPKWLKPRRSLQREETRSQLADVKEKIQRLTKTIEQRADELTQRPKGDAGANK